MDKAASWAYVPPMSLESQIIDLEIRIAHQDKLIASLDDVVREVSERVESLQRQVAEIRQGAAGQPNVGPGNDPPPHY